MIQFLLGILVAILTFHINHKLKKIIDIKILINSLFELYGDENSFIEYDFRDVNIQLMNEIVSLEKMYDGNPHIKKQVNKLIELRLVYFSYTDKNEAIKKLKDIEFIHLGNSFIILAFLNVRN